MNQLIRLVIKIFFATGVLFLAILVAFYTLLMIILMSFNIVDIKYGFPVIYFALVNFAIPSLGFGLIMALTLGPLQYFFVRKLTLGKPFDLSPIQHRTLTLPVSANVVWEQCFLALHKFPVYVVETNLEKNVIRAKTSATWKTWGDDIIINFSTVDNTTTRIDITCRPSLRTTIVDYGKNYENAEKLLKLLQN